jgi:predicted flavoprotein YhiN
MLTPYGVEGGVVYTLGAVIRDAIMSAGSCSICIDLLPDWSTEKIAARLAAGPGKESLSNFFRKRLGLAKAAFALLREASRGTSREAASVGDESAALRDPARAAALIKAVPVMLNRPRPIAEAISSAGGLILDECDDNLMLKKMPGVFCAGEMLSWESPTGGFLLQGCFSTAYRAASGCADWLAAKDSSPAAPREGN